MSFKVTLSPSGEEFSVEAAESVLDAAIRQGIGMPYGCRGGRCGACVAVVEEGQFAYPDQQPEAIDPTEEGRCLPCLCHPESDLKLQVRVLNSASEMKVRILPCRVHQIDHLAHDVVRLWLKLPQTQRLQFQAGQYLNFILADGRHRAFSIANAPHDDELIELHIRHVDGGEFTDWVFEKMQDKAIMRIEAPLGSFVLDEESTRPMLFIGGGTGFAPLKGQIEHAFYRGVERPMALYWGVRAKRDLYLPDLPQQWAEQQTDFNFVPVLSEPDADWKGRTGYVHEAVLEDIEDLTAYEIYMAGPPPMVSSAREAFLGRGVPESQLHYDAFEYAPDTRAKVAAAENPSD